MLELLQLFSAVLLTIAFAAGLAALLVGVPILIMEALEYTDFQWLSPILVILWLAFLAAVLMYLVGVRV